MKVHRLYKCQLCGMLYRDAEIIDIPSHNMEHTQENYDKLSGVLKESFYLSKFCFHKNGDIGQCLFSGFENVDE